MTSVRQPLSRRKKVLFIFLTSGLSLTLCLVLSELLLRVCGIQPWHNRDERGLPTMYEPDPILGWIKKPGHYIVRPFSKGGPETEVTNWSGGRRATAPREVSGRKTVAVLGCSCTDGWAVSDADTYAWKLQRRFPQVEVQNFGTAGYGTYQCLLVLERLLKGPHRPSLVVYGFIEGHESRNVATAEWLQSVSSQRERLAYVSLPYCTIDDEDCLQRHDPERYVSFPFRERLASVVFAERLFMKIKTRIRESQKREVTEKLWVEMNNLCRKHEVPLLMAMLSAKPECQSHYTEFCKAQGIALVDSVYPATPDMRVKGDGHPNGKGHDFFAEHIALALDEHLHALK